MRGSAVRLSPLENCHREEDDRRLLALKLIHRSDTYGGGQTRVQPAHLAIVRSDDHEVVLSKRASRPIGGAKGPLSQFDKQLCYFHDLLIGGRAITVMTQKRGTTVKTARLKT